MYFFFYSNNILFIIDDSLVNGNASVQHECETQLEKTSSSTTIELGSASHCLDANLSVGDETASATTDENEETTNDTYSSNGHIVEDTSLNVDIVEDTSLNVDIVEDTSLNVDIVENTSLNVDIVEDTSYISSIHLITFNISDTANCKRALTCIHTLPSLRNRLLLVSV